MQNLIDYLFNFTARELNESAWVANLPLNHSVALYSFFEGFRDYGELGMTLNDKDRIAEFSLLVIKNRMTQTFTTKLSYNNLLDGWKNSFRASPQSLYDSIYQVYDQIGEEIRKSDEPFFCSDELGWFKRFRERGPHRIRRFMESHFLEYFFRYHEGILLPFKEEKHLDFHEPKIFPEIIKEFPLTMLHKVVADYKVSRYNWSVGPCAEYIPEISEHEFDVDEYYPSESALMDVFLGMYLQKLVLHKKYPTTSDDNSLKYFISQGVSALKRIPAKDD